MITVGMNYTVIPGKEESFEKAFEGVHKALLKASGHVHSELFCSRAKAQTYLIISEWDQEGAFSDFIKSEQFKKVTQWGKEQILAGRPTHQVYTAHDLS